MKARLLLSMLLALSPSLAVAQNELTVTSAVADYAPGREGVYACWENRPTKNTRFVIGGCPTSLCGRPGRARPCLNSLAAWRKEREKTNECRPRGCERHS